jgi:hypothetical protein
MPADYAMNRLDELQTRYAAVQHRNVVAML